MRRRRERGFHKLLRLYRDLVDFSILFDNSKEPPSLVAKETAGALTAVDATLFNEIRRRAGIP